MGSRGEKNRKPAIRASPKRVFVNIAYETAVEPVFLGMVATIVLFDSVRHRLPKHLSDLNGTDPKIHDGTMEGTISGLLDVLGREKSSLSVDHVLPMARNLEIAADVLKTRNHKKNLFGAQIFRQLIAAASELAEEAGLIG